MGNPEWCEYVCRCGVRVDVVSGCVHVRACVYIQRAADVSAFL